MAISLAATRPPGPSPIPLAVILTSASSPRRPLVVPSPSPRPPRCAHEPDTSTTTLHCFSFSPLSSVSLVLPQLILSLPLFFLFILPFRYVFFLFLFPHILSPFLGKNSSHFRTCHAPVNPNLIISFILTHYRPSLALRSCQLISLVYRDDYGSSPSPISPPQLLSLLIRSWSSRCRSVLCIFHALDLIFDSIRVHVIPILQTHLVLNVS